MRNYAGHSAVLPTSARGERRPVRAIVTRTDGTMVAWPNALPAHLSPCRHDPHKGTHQHRCSASHAAMVESYRGWRDDAHAAAELATIGYAAELAEYWTDHQRPTFGAFLTFWHGSR